MSVADIVFWVALGLLGYTYAGYPLLLGLLCLLAPRRTPPVTDDWPGLTVLVAAHNEEATIDGKIRNILACDYPDDRVEVVVCSDGSTDRTNAIVEDFGDARVHLAATEENRGVNEAFAHGAAQASGDLLLMTDAAGLFEPDAFKTAIRHFADPKVACVNGLFDHSDPGRRAVASGYRGYWAVETLIKLAEMRLGLACVIVGAFEVIRRERYRPFPSHLSNDMGVPLELHAQGYRVVYEPRAVVRAPQRRTAGQEFRRRARMAVRGWGALPAMLRSVPPWKTPVNWLALLSHKHLRWLSGCLMLAVLAANVLLADRPFYQATLAVQGAFYAVALVGGVLTAAGRRVRLVTLPFYFCLVHAAATAGLVQALAGRRIRTWTEED